MRRVTAALAGLLIASPVLAQEPVTQEREHVVRDGDTLWDLAGFYYTNPFRWRVIYEANTTVVEDPHWIYPDEVLVIPGIRGDTEPDPRVAVATPPSGELRTVFYRPPPPPPQRAAGPTVLEEPGLRTLPVKPGEFASAPYLMDPSRLEPRALYMRPVREEGQSGLASAHPRDRVYMTYVRGVRPDVGERLVVVDVERRVDGAGRRNRVIRPKAVVQIVELSSDVIEGEILQQFGPLYPDRQMAVPVTMFPDFRVEGAEPVDGGADLEAQILEFLDEQPMYGPGAQAFINVGRRHGVQEGDIFQAYIPARAVRERLAGEFRGRIEQLPPERVAELRVVRVTDGFATVRADRVWHMELDEGLPVRRVRRMP